MAEPLIYEPEVSQCDHTGENMAADLAICPMPQGVEAHEIVVFGLAKSFFHHIPIQAGLDEVIGGPVSVIGDQKVLPKSDRKSVV